MLCVKEDTEMVKRIITISREFGSGGRFIGEEVAKNSNPNHNTEKEVALLVDKADFIANNDGSLEDLMEKAKEVHHKSYRYWKNEPLFDLVAVCVKCHAEITSMNRSVLNYDFIISNSRENKFFCKKRILFYII